MTWIVPPAPKPDLYEIEMGPTYGLAGTIRAGRVSITFERCLPLSARVRQVLWEEWDPIGVREMGGPSDEYDAYAPEITAMIVAGADAEAIARYLLQIEGEQIGLQPSPSRAQAVGQRLARLGSMPAHGGPSAADLA